MKENYDFDTLCKFAGKMYFESCLELDRLMKLYVSTIQEAKQKLSDKDKIIEELNREMIKLKGG